MNEGSIRHATNVCSDWRPRTSQWVKCHLNRSQANRRAHLVLRFGAPNSRGGFSQEARGFVRAGSDRATACRGLV